MGAGECVVGRTRLCLVTEIFARERREEMAAGTQAAMPASMRDLVHERVINMMIKKVNPPNQWKVCVMMVMMTIMGMMTIL
jgi:hypothetical protein